MLSLKPFGLCISVLWNIPSSLSVSLLPSSASFLLLVVNSQPLRLFCAAALLCLARGRAYLMHVSVDFSTPSSPHPSLYPSLACIFLSFSLHSHSFPLSPLKRAKCFTSVNSWVWEELIIVEKERNSGLGATFVDRGSCLAKRAIRITDSGRLTCVSWRYYSLITGTQGFTEL